MKPGAGTVAGTQGLRITLIGQVRGGKNNMGVTKSGRHYPGKLFAKWSKDAIEQIDRQVFKKLIIRPLFTDQVSMTLDYVAGDRRRRDFPAICDALFHCLERSGVVADDSLIWIERSSRGYDKERPRCEITLRQGDK